MAKLSDGRGVKCDLSVLCNQAFYKPKTAVEKGNIYQGKKRWSKKGTNIHLRWLRKAVFIQLIWSYFSHYGTLIKACTLQTRELKPHWMPCSNGCALMWVRVSWGGLSIYTDKCYLDVYRGYLLGKRFPEFFYHTLLDDCPGVSKHMLSKPTAGQG